MSKMALKEGEKVSRQAMGHLLLLGIIKLAAGLLTGMTVIIADAISTFADTLGLFASYFGLRLSRKSADKKFKYGYYKIETFAALFVSLGTIYAGYAILSRAINNIGVMKEGVHKPFAITTTIIAIVFSIRLYKKLKKAGENANSLSLIANAREKKMDVFAGFIVLVSIIANYQQIPYVESVVTILISTLILKVGLSSAKESLFFLLDYWDNPSLVRKIRKEFRKEKDLITKVNKIRLRRAGTFIFGEAFVELNPFAEIKDLREELDLLNDKIMKLDPYIRDFPIYTHITKEKNIKIAVPIESGRSLKAKIASNLKKTNAYLFARVSNGRITDFYIKKLSEKSKKPIEFAEFLKKEKVKIIINNKLHSLIYYNLRRTHHIQIYPNLAGIKTAEEAIKLLLIDT
ncbi:MAG: cation diffusion facilitator family transporter [Nitrospirae bacterium]|nr:cation diffusion facilitator family transporter [Nitrospirota bacterium]